MAKIIKRTKRHDCRAEIAETINHDEVYFGTIVECSCSKRFIWSDNQFGDPGWLDHAPSKMEAGR